MFHGSPSSTGSDFDIAIYHSGRPHKVLGVIIVNDDNFSHPDLATVSSLAVEFISLEKPGIEVMAHDLHYHSGSCLRLWWGYHQTSSISVDVKMKV
ncbi:hypothetical protein OUZ56_032704 [Daphnia magna]|uniref:Uncharacterized protein n=1 Tax=Daphnia magna TaxID=35525 RepID=A0ABQ9ZWW2_9CRUS|nr:hypothetical protein OUZ56_032704 [Daphnia magna]